MPYSEMNSRGASVTGQAGKLGWPRFWTLVWASAWFCIAGIAGAEEAALATTPGMEKSPTVVFLVRHAEKVLDGSRDPALSSVGEERSLALANLLAPAGITHIWSSDYQRTRNTAAPLAADLGLEVRLYDPRNLTALASEIQEIPGRHLVVGHSNTTPEAAKRLGGDPGEPIDEAKEYDRLYVVMLLDSGAETVRLKY